MERESVQKYIIDRNDSHLRKRKCKHEIMNCKSLQNSMKIWICRHLGDLVEISLQNLTLSEIYKRALFSSFQIGLELSEACAKLNFASFRLRTLKEDRRKRAPSFYVVQRTMMTFVSNFKQVEKLQFENVEK